MEAGLRVHHGGSGEPVLLLLHGLGATGDVWDAWRPLLNQRWPGRWLAPDLPGHGGSRPLPSYTFETLAAAVADLVGPGTPTVVLGHSLGGVVGLALAGGEFGVPVQAVIGLGIKVAWTEEELGRARAAAQRSPAWFPSRDEAAARYLRISGLAGLLTAADPAVEAGLQEQHWRWRLAMDPGAFAVGAPDMKQLLARCQAPVTLARGEHDAMNTEEQFTRLGVPTVTLPGLGHNAHVENPHLSITLLDLPGQDVTVIVRAMTRIPYLRREELGPEGQQLWDSIVDGLGDRFVTADGGLAGPFNAFVTAPGAGRRLSSLGATLLAGTSVPQRLSELAIITVGARWQAEFEWWAHAPMARAHGVADAVVEAIGRGEDPPFEVDDERAVYTAARQLAHAGRLDQETYNAAHGFLGDAGMVELVSLCGYYTLISFLLNAFAVPLPPQAAPMWA